MFGLSIVTSIHDGTFYHVLHGVSDTAAKLVDNLAGWSAKTTLAMHIVSCNRKQH